MRMVLRPRLIPSKTVYQHCYLKVPGKSRFPNAKQLFLVMRGKKPYHAFLCFFQSSEGETSHDCLIPGEVNDIMAKKKVTKTIDDINRKIKEGKVVVVTADEMVISLMSAKFMDL